MVVEAFVQPAAILVSFRQLMGPVCVWRCRPGQESPGVFFNHGWNAAGRPDKFTVDADKLMMVAAEAILSTETCKRLGGGRDVLEWSVKKNKKRKCVASMSVECGSGQWRKNLNNKERRNRFKDRSVENPAPSKSIVFQRRPSLRKKF